MQSKSQLRRKSDLFRESEGKEPELLCVFLSSKRFEIVMFVCNKTSWKKTFIHLHEMSTQLVLWKYAVNVWSKVTLSNLVTNVLWKTSVLSCQKNPNHGVFKFYHFGNYNYAIKWKPEGSWDLTSAYTCFLYSWKTNVEMLINGCYLYFYSYNIMDLGFFKIQGASVGAADLQGHVALTFKLRWYF